ncbi:MAG: vWA domain-containing protein [Woeseiaceae bacterium]
MSVNRKSSNFIALWTMLGILCTTSAQATRVSLQEEQKQPVDLVIALDVSGSMSGLIDSAKQRLWDIVNELAQANPQPDLRMAILTYGNPSYGEQSGFVRIDMPFTRDLDAINQTLFSFGTNGGDEYVSRVIHRSLTDLKWSDNPDALKILFVAGNEEADQDPEMSVGFVSKVAANNGIVVNTIYCGGENDAIVAGWREFSTLTNGLFASINQDVAAVANIATPMDDQLVELNKELNETYIAFGKDGDARKANQIEQDKNSETMSAPSIASRTLTKISALYDNTKWDLVDAFESGAPVADMKTEDLPEPMQTMNVEEREEYVEELAAKRQSISARIQEIGGRRDAYIDAERAQLSGDADAGLDTAIIGGVRELAEKKGFEFEN